MAPLVVVLRHQLLQPLQLVPLCACLATLLRVVETVDSVSVCMMDLPVLG